MNNTTVVEKLFYHAKHTPDKTAVIFEGAGITYAELWNKAVRLAQLFKKMGLCEGDRMICQCKYDFYYVASIYAAHLCGAAVVPVDKNADGKMIADMAEKLDARLVVCNQMAERFPNCILYGGLSDNLPEEYSMEGLAFPAPETVAVIVFTTGTTGAPKGVQLTQRNTNGYITKCFEFTTSSNSVSLAAVPLNHVAPFMTLQHFIYIGGTMIFMDGMLKIKQFFEYMDSYGVTTIYIPPSGISLLQRIANEKLANYTNQLEYITSASSAISVSQRDYMKKILLNTRLYNVYGSSETGIVSSYRYDNNERDISCCGKASKDVEIRIVDDAFQSVPIGQVGLITVKSDMVMKGYYNQPEQDSAVLRDGFFISNDLGFLDEEGYLYVCGRKDDIINVGGLKVYPTEIEEAALKIPGVVDCICFGVPDSITGHAIKLLIQTDDSFTLSVVLVQERLGHMMDAYKVPKSIEIVDEIVKTANGKPNRKYYQQKTTSKNDN